jgi:hypothetical protein
MEYESFLADRLKTLNSADPASLRGLISYIFITNIMKYISVLRIKASEIDFQAIPINERIKIGESLPAKLTRGIILEIDKHFGKKIQEVLSFEFEHESEKYEGSIEINNNLFVG